VVRTFAKGRRVSRMLHASILERIFVVPGMQPSGDASPI
jgi:hypothetical protein